MSRYVIVFMIFSFLGWIWESIYCTACKKQWANRGFLYGPVCPIYGNGAILGLFLYDLTEKGIMSGLSLWQIFFMGFTVSMILEYPTSLILERIFHARWWDYSRIPLNMKGRTSVPTSIAFGGVAILVMEVLLPLITSWMELFPDGLVEFFALFTVAVISADFTLTVSALTDFQKRVEMAEEKFQNRMSEAVEQLYTARHSVFRSAVRRISVYRFEESKNGGKPKKNS